MIEITLDTNINIYMIVDGSNQYEFDSESAAIQKAEELAGTGNYFINPMIDVDARYRG